MLLHRDLRNRKQKTLAQISLVEKELLEEIQKGWFDFDVIVATPNMMGELGKLGRLLGLRA